MKLIPIDPVTISECKKTDKGLKREGDRWPWWRIPHDKLPPMAIEAVSISSGQVNPGLTVYLIGGHNRDIFPDGAPKGGLKIHEYVGLVKFSGWQPLVQLGRDVEMV